MLTHQKNNQVQKLHPNLPLLLRDDGDDYGDGDSGHDNGEDDNSGGDCDDSDCDDGGCEKKFPLHLCPALSTVAYLIPFLSIDRPSQCFHFTKEVLAQNYNALLRDPSVLQPPVQCHQRSH